MSGAMITEIAIEIARLAAYPAHSNIRPVCFCKAYVNRTDAMPLTAAAMIAPTRRVPKALASALAAVDGFCEATAENTATPKSTPAMTPMIIPTKNSTIARTTFRAWVVQNIVPSLFEVPQRGQVRLVANFPLRYPEQNRG